MSSFCSDLRTKRFIWLKILFFLQLASLGVIWVATNAHLASLGFSASDVFLINAIAPSAVVIAAPPFGLIADKMGEYRIFAAFVTFISGISALTFFAVPEIKSVSASIDDGFICCGIPSPGESLFCTDEDSVALKRLDGLNCTSGAVECPQLTCLPLKADNRDSALVAYVIVRFIRDALFASSVALFEGAVIVNAAEFDGDIGFQRIFGALGFLIFAPLTTLLSSSGAFYLFFGLRTLSALLTFKVKLKFKPKSKNVFREIGGVFKSVDVLAFLTAFIASGLFQGFMESELEDSRTSKLIKTLTLILMSVVAIALNITSTKILRNFGFHFIALYAITFHSIRFIGHALIFHAHWTRLFIDALAPFSSALFFTTAMNFVKETSPLTVTTTAQGLFIAAYWGLGRGLGLVLSEYVSNMIMGVASLAISGLYAVIVIKQEKAEKVQKICG